MSSLDNAFWIEPGRGQKPAYWVVKKADGTDPQDYPVDVLDVDGNVIGNAANKTQYMNIWNAVENNVVTKGYLIGEYYPFVFELSKRIKDVIPAPGGGGGFVLSGFKPLVSFRVGAPGKMQDGEVRFTHPGLAGKRVLVLAGGIALPNDDGSGEVDFAGSIERHVVKAKANDYLDIIFGVADKEIITIYVF